MATSGAMNTDNQYVKYTISVTQNSQNVASNTSNVTVKVRFYRTNEGYSTYGTGTVYCMIDGVTYSSNVTSSQKITNSGIFLFSKTLNIKHATNGAKTLTCLAWIKHDVVNSSAQSYNQTLTTIPRKSSLSVGNGTLGSSQKLTITRQSSAFSHTITAVCGSASVTVCTKSTSTEVNFTPPLSWASQNTTGTSLSVKYTITTYTGSTSLGSNSYTKTCTIPNTVKPSCTIAVSDPTGRASEYGGYLQGLSKFKIIITAEKSYNSPISSYSTKANGTTYASSTFTSGVIKTSGNVTITSKVTDQRGRSGSNTATVAVLAYAAPTIEKMTVNRCDADGTTNKRGAYTKVTFSYAVTSLNNKNKVVCTIKYKKAKDKYYTAVTQSDLSTVYTANDQTYIFASDIQSSYDITLSVADDFTATTKKTVMTSAFNLMSWLSSGFGMAVGKIAELTNYLDVAFKTMFRDDVVMANDKTIQGGKPDGTVVNCFTPQNVNGNTVIGHGNFIAKNGATNIYGHNVFIGVSDVADGNNLYKPYYSRGDVISINFRTAGYITNSMKDLSFWLPLSKPVIGAPVATAASINGFMLRQGAKYTHGSSSTVFTSPASYEIAATYGAGVYVKASFTNTTNATNNESIGVYWSGKITLS